MRQNRRNLFVGILICVMGMVGLVSVGKAEARKGGLPLCLEELATCTNDLGTCQTDLEACEAAPSAVFPGDGVTGPALSYTDNGDGTFTDNNTQLMWEKKDVAGVHNVVFTYQWSSSSRVEEPERGGEPDGSLFLSFLATLNTAPCFAGHCDWRIPNIKELQSLVDYSKVEPATSVPGATAAAFYWSSTSFVLLPNTAWMVYFGFGGMDFDFKGADSHARAVRGGS